MEVGSSDTHLPSSHRPPIDVRRFAPGAIVADRYRIVALAGRGGMGEVYRADDLKLGQAVALKFLPPGLERDPAARDRLLAEVRSARTVSHPNVCRVYDVGEVADRVFLTMEYIDGEDLASLLRRIGRLPAAKALEIARQLCAGLAAAHDKGVLHRDLKPANVMIDGRGQTRITDFGLAVEASATGSPADAAGTLAYMAPERFRGMPATVQSDLYGLGLILYETYAGKPAFSANSVREWERAHSDSTPTSPSALATDVQPAVERAILRCLEKEPSKRPASAAQVAAALPGGDPLAAAIAAGETPSPELVAASGEEGTLPRAKAWLWLAVCLVALAIAPFTWMPFSLVEHIPFELSPDTLQARARQTLQDLGYPDRPADSAWWFRADGEYLVRLNGLRPSEASAELRTAAAPGPLRFCYRQGASALTPLSFYGAVSTVDPPPRPADAYVELDLGGRLVALRVTPPVYGDGQPAAGGVNWTALFAAAHLGAPDAFVQVAPQWWPESAADVREARQGVYAGQKVRVEAAARAGLPISFHLLIPGTAARSPAGTEANHALVAPAWVVTPSFWASFIVLAALARRNLRLGRSDRVAARTLAVAAVVAWTARLGLANRSLMAALDTTNGPGLLAQPLLLGLFFWVAYLGLEPPFRRAWPHLLITSTRLLDGRWRDPLVGRAVLAGVLVGLVFALPGSVAIGRALDLPGGGPTLFYSYPFGSGRSFVASRIETLVVATLATVLLLTVLLVARLIVRRAAVAWVVLAVLMVGSGYVGLQYNRPATISPVVLLPVAAAWWLLLLWLLWKHGALALAVAFVVFNLVEPTPWTLDMSRWYAWRGGLTLAVIAALAFWGFKNVLGRQSAFPTGALDG